MPALGEQREIIEGYGVVVRKDARKTGFRGIGVDGENGLRGTGQGKARLQAMRSDRDPAIVPIWVSRVDHHTTCCRQLGSTSCHFIPFYPQNKCLAQGRCIHGLFVAF